MNLKDCFLGLFLLCSLSHAFAANIQQKEILADGPIGRDIELRGVFQFGNSLPMFSLFDRTENKSCWMALHESCGRFEIVEYRRDRGIVVSADGQFEEIVLANGGSGTIASELNAPTATVASESLEKRKVTLLERIRKRRALSSGN